MAILTRDPNGRLVYRVNKHAETVDRSSEYIVDRYFSVDVETDGPIPGPYSMLSFGIVYAGSYDGKRFLQPRHYKNAFYRELKPISENFEKEALLVNGLDRDALMKRGSDPAVVMTECAEWVRNSANGGTPVVIAFPISFDWTWLYWYFVRFSETGSPFKHSSCFDIKTAIAVKTGRPISASGRKNLPKNLKSRHSHTHHALDDAREQADIFSKLFERENKDDAGGDQKRVYAEKAQRARRAFK